MPVPFPASSFEVGNAPNAPNFAAPLVNFSQLAQLPDEFFKGTQQKRTLALQNAFPDGLPQKQDADGNIIRDQNGNSQIDVDAIDLKLSKIGGAEYAQGIRPFLLYGQMGRAAANVISGNDDNAAPPPTRPPGVASGPSGPGNITGPQRNGAPGGPTNSAVPAQPTLSSVGTDDAGQTTMRSMISETFGDRDMSPIIPRLAAGLKIDPDAPLSPVQQATVKTTLARIQASGVQPGTPAQPSATTGGGTPVNPVGGTGGNGAPNPSVAPETAAPSTGIQPNAPPQGGQPPSAMQPNAAPQVPGVPAGADPGGFANALLKRAQAEHAQAAQYAAYPGGQAMAQSIENDAKAKEERAKQIFDFMGTAAQPTPDIKQYQLYRQQGGNLAFNQWQAENAGSVAAAQEQAKGDLGTIKDLSDAGIEAKGQIGQLNVIKQLGDKVAFGVVPKVQSFLGKYGVNTDGLTDIQAYERAIDYMAPQLRPIGSGRLMQQELTAFKSALGGLMTTPEGRRISVNNLGLIAGYKTQIGQIASDTSLSPSARIQKIYTVEPPHLVTSMPGQSNGQQNAPQQNGPQKPTQTQASLQFSSPAQAQAAMQAGKIKSGDVITTPQGSYRMK